MYQFNNTVNTNYYYGILVENIFLKSSKDVLQHNKVNKF